MLLDQSDWDAVMLDRQSDWDAAMSVQSDWDAAIVVRLFDPFVPEFFFVVFRDSLLK